MQDTIGGGSQVKGWSDAEVDQALAHFAIVETNSTLIEQKQSNIEQQFIGLNTTVLWLFCFFIIYVGYNVSRHFTFTEREING